MNKAQRVLEYLFMLGGVVVIASISIIILTIIFPSQPFLQLEDYSKITLYLKDGTNLEIHNLSGKLILKGLITFNSRTEGIPNLIVKAEEISHIVAYKKFEEEI